jgi:CRISPR-associated protein Cas6
MRYVDLAFRVIGERIPVDHGYALYAAMSRVVPSLHSLRDVAVHPVRGRYTGGHALRLTRMSRVAVRVPHEHLAAFLPLAGQRLDVDGHAIRLGVPDVRAIQPAARLFARLVTIKGFLEAEAFRDAATRQLGRLGVAATLDIGVRRTLRVRDKQVVGFEVIASGLDPESSIQLQVAGIGGRRHMGCGVFVIRAKRSNGPPPTAGQA